MVEGYRTRQANTRSLGKSTQTQNGALNTWNRIDGTIHTLPPADRKAWDRAVPVYETLPGWKSDTTACTRYDELPAEAKAYLTRLSELCGAPIAFVGVGPDRVQTLVVQ